MQSQGDDDEFINTISIDSVDLVDFLETRRPLATSWSPIRVRRVHPTSSRKIARKVDLPFYGSHVMFLRPRAVDALRSDLNSSGELLDVEDEGGDDLCLFNVLVVVDALSLEESEIKYFSDGRIMRIKKYVFRPDRIEGVDLFRIPQMRSSPIFVSQRFVDKVHELQLTGVRFVGVWPQSQEHP